MDTAKMKQLVVRFVELMTTGQADKFGEVIAESYNQHGPGVAQGLTGIQQRTKQLEHVFADVTVNVDAIVAEGDIVVARFTWTGIHKGEFQGIPATNKKVSWAGTDWWRVEAGKLAEHWDNVEWASLIQQLQAN